MLRYTLCNILSKPHSSVENGRSSYRPLECLGVRKGRGFPVAVLVSSIYSFSIAASWQRVFSLFFSIVKLGP